MVLIIAILFDPTYTLGMAKFSCTSFQNFYTFFGLTVN